MRTVLEMAYYDLSMERSRRKISDVKLVLDTWIGFNNQLS